jgi:glycerol-3-phosphate cytidylyltransferase
VVPFDLFHAGHSDLLRRCYELGDVVVALNTDEFIKDYKGKAPIHSYEEREEVLLSCRYVAGVVPNEGGADSKPSILKVRPDYVAIGSDWAPRNYYKQMGFTQDWLDSQDITLVYVPRIRRMSSTLVKERVKS